MAEKIDRKQLRRPDEFQVVAGKAMEWVAGRQRQVALAVGALVLVVLLAWGLGICAVGSPHLPAPGAAVTLVAATEVPGENVSELGIGGRP